MTKKTIHVSIENCTMKKSLQTDVSVEKKFTMYASTLMLIAYYIKGIEEINEFQSHLFTLFGHYYEIE